MTRIELQQGTPEWLAWRLNGITATEAACIGGDSPWGTALSVYYNKLNPPENIPSEYQEWGSLLEDVIKYQKFAKIHPEFEVRQGGCYQGDVPWQRCSLDGELYNKDGEWVANLEIKTSSNEAAWETIPDYYYAQVQWQMYITKVPLTYVAVLINGHHYIERTVEFDKDYALNLVERCAAVWDAVLAKTPPDVDDTRAAIDQGIINKLAVETSDKADAYAIAEERYKAFVEARDAVADATEKFNVLKLELSKHLVKAKTITCNGKVVGRMVQMKGRDTIDSDKLKCDFPEVYAQVIKHGRPSAYPKFG